MAISMNQALALARKQAQEYGMYVPSHLMFTTQQEADNYFGVAGNYSKLKTNITKIYIEDIEELKVFSGSIENPYNPDDFIKINSIVKGMKGDTGTAATIQVGTVSSGESAFVGNSGDVNNAIFNFVLPKGDKGDTGATGATGASGLNWTGEYNPATMYVENDACYYDGSSYYCHVASSTGNLPTDQIYFFPLAIQGISGQDGQDGVNATLAVGTVQTGDAGTNVEVSNVGTNSEAILNFTIPKGDKGDTGDVGMVWRENYSATETYNLNDLVTYGDSVWICVSNGTIGITPTEEAIEWDLFCKSAVYNDFIGTDGLSDGMHGLVPAPLASDEEAFISSAGQWIDNSKLKWTDSEAKLFSQKVEAHSVKGVGGYGFDLSDNVSINIYETTPTYNNELFNVVGSTTQLTLGTKADDNIGSWIQSYKNPTGDARALTLNPSGGKVNINNIYSFEGDNLNVGSSFNINTGDNFRINDGSVVRFEHNVNETIMRYQDNQFKLSNVGSGLKLNLTNTWSLWCTSIATSLRCPVDGDGHLDVGSKTLTYNDGTNDRMFLGTNYSAINSPGGASSFKIFNNTASISLDGSGQNSFHATSTETYLSNSQANGGHIRLPSKEFHYSDSTRDRILVDGNTTTITSSNGEIIAEVTDELFRVKVGSTSSYFPLWASATDNYLYTPEGNGIRVKNSALTYKDSNRFRLDINGSDSKLISASGTHNLNVTDSAVEATKFNIGGNMGSGLFNVTQENTGGHVAGFYNSGTGSNSDGIFIRLNTFTLQTSNNLISFYNSTNSIVGQIEGNGSGGVQYTTTSDRRLKTNIVDTAYTIADLMKIKIRDYNPICDESITCTGVIAQELNEALPQHAPDKGEEIWTVEYGRLTPYIIKAVQDLYKEIQELKK